MTWITRLHDSTHTHDERVRGLTCPAFSMLMRSLGQLFETLRQQRITLFSLKTFMFQLVFIVRQLGWRSHRHCRRVVGQQPVKLQYLPTRPANGWTCRDVPIMMRRSQRGKSWLIHKKAKRFKEWTVAEEPLGKHNSAQSSPSSLKWRTEQEGSLQKRRYLDLK